MISFMIIVPTLDSHCLLPALVNSLQQQTFTNWRVQFIDGASAKPHRQYLDLLCKQDNRFDWDYQLCTNAGIFGAMNQGIKSADLSNDWILFWGSDDQAASPLVLESVAKKLQDYILQDNPPDLLVCDGTYYHQEMGTLKDNDYCFGRKTKFTFRNSFRHSLFLGSTPPHQATFFGPGALSSVHEFATELKLSADLDYFLKLSQDPTIKVVVEDLDLVWIGDCGISKQETKRRLTEVRMAYRRAFGNKWWIPFFLRYLQRIQSVVETR